MADITIGSTWNMAPGERASRWQRVTRRFEVLRRLHRLRRRVRGLDRALAEADTRIRDDLGVGRLRRSNWIACMIQR